MTVIDALDQRAKGFTIRKQLLGGFGAVICVLFGLAVFMLSEMATINDHLVELHDDVGVWMRILVSNCIIKSSLNSCCIIRATWV